MRSLAALLLSLCAALPARAAPPSYTLEAQLDGQQPLVRARAQVRFTNTSRSALPALELHLYANAFSGPRTVFMRQGGIGLRRVPLKREGGIELESLTLADATDLLARASYGDDPDDRTQLHVPLPAPLSPGESLELHMRFQVRLPSLAARMGRARELSVVAQWFPKLARLEPNGSFSQHPYYGLGEFSADFADYDVTLRAPADHVLVAPGERMPVAFEDGARVERYRLQRVLDFAWAASPALELVSTRAGPTRVEVYVPPGQGWLGRRQARLMREALAELSALLGPYPHRRLAMLMPPAHGRGAAGMEYAGLVLGWIAPRRSALDPALRIAQDFVTTHELAHQWFPMLVASHEAEEPVLDEGLAQWAGMHVLRQRYGRRGIWQRLLGLPVDLFDVQRVLWARSGVRTSSLRPAHAYTLGELSASVYQRPALLLESVRRSWGPARFDRTLGAYAREHRYRQVTHAELCEAFDRGYWPGFCARVLLPALRGEPVPWPSVAEAGEEDPHGHVLLHRSRRDVQKRTDPGAPRPAWLARVLYLGQLLIAAVSA